VAQFARTFAPKLEERLKAAEAAMRSDGPGDASAPAAEVGSRNGG
jgi:hypothetical protein